MTFLFAWRYFRAKKSTNAVNVIAWISMVAIMIGTTALILLLSVFNGFESLVKSLYSSFYTDLKIFPRSGKVMQVTPEQLKQLHGLSGIRNYSLIIEEKAFLQNGDNQSLVYLKGVDNNYSEVAGVADHLVDGEYDLGTETSPKIILGGGVEGALGIQSDRSFFYLNIYLPRKGKNESFDVTNDISSDSIQASGAFMIQADFDNKYGITNLDFMRTAIGLDSTQYSSIEIKIGDPDQADEMKQRVTAIFGNNYLVQTRYEQNQNLYGVMNMERWIIYAVLCLILIVCAFTMVGALTVLVLEKRKDIGVLNALGAGRRFIRRIFLAEGFLLAAVGGTIGMLIALIVVILQTRYHFIPLQGGSFLIDYFPVQLRATDFLLVGITIFVIAFLGSIIPAQKAARERFSG